MQAKWYVLRSKPHKEDALYHHARSQGCTIFYPRIPVQRVNPRAKPMAAYFPGYMFVRANLAEVGVSTFEYMPHALGLVAFDGEPAAVDDAIIAAIKECVKALVAAGGETFLGLNPGDPVVITSGPLKGVEAIFDARLNGGDRVRVLLALLSNRAVPAELSAAQIEKRQGVKRLNRA